MTVALPESVGAEIEIETGNGGIDLDFPLQVRRASRDYFERLASSPEGAAALGRTPGWRDTYRQLYEFSTSLFDWICVWAGLDDGFRLIHQAEGHFAHLPDAEGERANPLGKCGDYLK